MAHQCDRSAKQSPIPPGNRRTFVFAMCQTTTPRRTMYPAQSNGTGKVASKKHEKKPNEAYRRQSSSHYRPWDAIHGAGVLVTKHAHEKRDSPGCKLRNTRVYIALRPWPCTATSPFKSACTPLPRASESASGHTRTRSLTESRRGERLRKPEFQSCSVELGS